MHMSPLKFVQILLLLGFFQQAQTLPPAAPQGPDVPSAFRISGRVLDAISGQPLAHASVTINVSASPGERASFDSGRTEFTDPDGRFAFAEVSTGKYFLTAHRRGY